MKTTKKTRHDAKQLFQVCLVGGRLDEGRVRAAVQQVIDRKPRGCLQILHHFQRLVRLEVEKHTARLETVLPLPDPLRRGLEAALTRRHGPGLEFAFAQNPALIGGLRAQVGSDVYDGTIRTRLEELLESFN